VSKPIVSFCIATYNRAERVCALVKSILSCERQDIEVCVNDNASADNTKELLGEINDPRFRFFENEINIGAIKNMLMAISKANGKYAFYCNDRDLIEIENIPKLCDFLIKKNFAYVYCGDALKETIYDSPVDAFANLLFFKHPTGEIFNAEMLAKLNIKRYWEFDENSLYLILPFYFVFTEIASLGSSAEIPNMYWKASDDDFIKNNPSRSGFTKGGWSWRYFLPAEVAPTVVSGLEHIINMRLFNKAKINKICYSVFKNEAIRSVTFYIGAMQNPIYAYRYNYDIIVDNIFDQFLQYRSFYKIYRSSSIYAYHSVWRKFGLFMFGVYMFYFVLVRRLKIYLLYKSKIKKLIWRLNLIRLGVLAHRL
jgi:glycosyltransferase involved in cell wall biosynthesis